eukprot:2139786-Rhodomonas_salina.1
MHNRDKTLLGQRKSSFRVTDGTGRYYTCNLVPHTVKRYCCSASTELLQFASTSDKAGYIIPTGRIFVEEDRNNDNADTVTVCSFLQRLVGVSYDIVPGYPGTDDLYESESWGRNLAGGPNYCTNLEIAGTGSTIAYDVSQYRAVVLSTLRWPPTWKSPNILKRRKLGRWDDGDRQGWYGKQAEIVEQYCEFVPTEEVVAMRSFDGGSDGPAQGRPEKSRSTAIDLAKQTANMEDARASSSKGRVEPLQGGGKPPALADGPCAPLAREMRIGQVAGSPTLCAQSAFGPAHAVRVQMSSSRSPLTSMDGGGLDRDTRGSWSPVPGARLPGSISDDRVDLRVESPRAPGSSSTVWRP